MATLVFHAVIPYVASDQGVPNCLQCHAVRAGTVLGAVTVDIPFTEVRPGHDSRSVMVSRPSWWRRWWRWPCCGA
jgi:hypothetical protein